MIFKKQVAPALLNVQKIWDSSAHNAFTDLIRYKEEWFCSFRESDVHVGGQNGLVRILSSKDGVGWKTAALFKEEGIDLRDPKLSITPTGQLMLLCGGTVYDSQGKYDYLQSRVAFSDNGKQWSPFTPILTQHEWLWRLTWHRGKAYGASYSRSVPKDKLKEWHIKLFESSDGIKWDPVTKWEIPGYPNETTLRFLSSGQMVALVRRDKKFDNRAWLGISDPPYTHWNWEILNYHIGGPNFIVMADDAMWIAGRMLFTIPYAELERTFLGTMDFNVVKCMLTLPSGGDCSYPGLVYHDGILWISYYSSHESKAAIYLARVAL